MCCLLSNSFVPKMPTQSIFSVTSFISLNCVFAGYLSEIMKLIKAEDTVTFPEGVTFEIKKRVVIVHGPRGTLRRDFRHLHMEMIRQDKNVLVVRKWFGVRKELAAIRTVCSHIENMVKGVTKGFRYKMRAVYAHFPINVSLQDKGKLVEVCLYFLLSTAMLSVKTSTLKYVSMWSSSYNSLIQNIIFCHISDP